MISSKPGNDQETVETALRADEAEIAALYAEFAEEDCALADAGMAEYAAGLVREDALP